MRTRWRGIGDRGRAVGLALTASLLFPMLVAAGPLAAAPPGLPALLAATAAQTGPAPAAGPGARRRAILRQRLADARLGALIHGDGSPAAGVGQRIDLNLFDDAKFAMTIGDVTRHAGRGYTWSGTLDGIDHGYAVLAVHAGALAGQIVMPHAVYRIGYAADGTQVVQQIDQAALPREADPIVPPLGPIADSPDVKVGAEIPDVAADTASQIDVMVLYTPAARAAAGGAAAMQAEVDLSVSLANQAYANNALVQRLRLVFAGEIGITEHTGPNSFNDDLDALKDNNPTVAWLRSVTRADLVSLITDHGPDPPFCGLGFLMIKNSTTFAEFGFSVVERICASALLTFAHELGHNMGAHHDPYVAGADKTLFPYSHGYVDVVGKFRTIMAYNDQCLDAGFSCNRISYFSTPGMTSGGRVIGTASASDNARTLAQTANTVANLSQALVGPPTVTTAVNKPVFAVGDTLVVSVGLDNAGRTGTADIYAGILLPDNSVAFFTSAVITPSGGFALGNVLNFASYRPIVTRIPLTTPFSVNIPSFVSYKWTGAEPRGGFALFLLVTTTGALADGKLEDNELLGASLTPFSFPP